MGPSDWEWHQDGWMPISNTPDSAVALSGYRVLRSSPGTWIVRRRPMQGHVTGCLPKNWMWV